MSGLAPTLRYAARTAPLRPETVWTLEAHALVETAGQRSRSLPLAGLRAIRLEGTAGTRRRAAHLTFTGGRVMIPAQSLSGPVILEDRSAAFDAFLTAMERASGLQATGAAVSARRAPSLAGGLVWGIGLTAAGALLMMLAALLSGMPGLGLALGARLLFAAILLAAVLPWLGRDKRI